MKPASASGKAQLAVSSAGGAFGDFSAFSAGLDCDVTAGGNQAAGCCIFKTAGASLGELAVSGPLDMEKMEGRLQVKLQGIDRRLLNLAGAARGIDFGTTTISSTNEITLAKSGRPSPPPAGSSRTGSR